MMRLCVRVCHGLSDPSRYCDDDAAAAYHSLARNAYTYTSESSSFISWEFLSFKITGNLNPVEMLIYFDKRHVYRLRSKGSTIDCNVIREQFWQCSGHFNFLQFGQPESFDQAASPDAVYASYLFAWGTHLSTLLVQMVQIFGWQFLRLSESCLLTVLST